MIDLLKQTTGKLPLRFYPVDTGTECIGVIQMGVEGEEIESLTECVGEIFKLDENEHEGETRWSIQGGFWYPSCQFVEFFNVPTLEMVQGFRGRLEAKLRSEPETLMKMISDAQVCSKPRHEVEEDCHYIEWQGERQGPFRLDVPATFFFNGRLKFIAFATPPPNAAGLECPFLEVVRG